MRDVRRLVATGPWPVQVAVMLGLLALVCWPLFLRTESPPFALFSGAAVAVIALLVQRRQDARDTGWTPAEQYEVLRRAYAGELPADPADRSRLLRLVTRYAREQRHLHWVELVAFAALAAVVLSWSDTFPGRSEWAVAAYDVLLGIGAFVLLRRKQGRRTALLARSGAVGVEGSERG